MNGSSGTSPNSVVGQNKTNGLGYYKSGGHLGYMATMNDKSLQKKKKQNLNINEA